MKKVSIEIDNKNYVIDDTQTILDVCRENSIEIPTLCFHKQLTNAASCRMCIVEVDGARTLLPSCSTPVTDGMKISTSSEKVKKQRRMILELTLAEYKDSIDYRESSSPFKRYLKEYGVEDSRFIDEKFKRDLESNIDDRNSFFIRDMNKCINCGQCVRVCEEIQLDNAYAFANRGHKLTIDKKYYTDPYRGEQETSCVSCGNCVEVCPTGALIPKNSSSKPIPKRSKKIKSTCCYCGVGCQLNLIVDDDSNEIYDVEPCEAPETNNGWLCVKGRFGMDFVNSKERLTDPLIKENGKFRKASWDEAYDKIVNNINRIIDDNGPRSLYTLSSAKATNEENYLLQKLARAVWGSNNIDHCARLCHSPSFIGLLTSLGAGAMTNATNEVKKADCIFIIGTNITATQPITALKVKEAVKNGTKLIVADIRKVAIAEKADIFMQLNPGSNIALINGLLHVIIKENLFDKEFIDKNVDGFEELKVFIEKYPLDRVEEITSVPKELIVKAARMYAKADKASLLYSMGITQYHNGTQTVFSLVSLPLITGNLGRESTGMNPLRGQNNVQGASDMGALPGVYPGYQKVTDEKARERFMKAWDVDYLDPDHGVFSSEMFHKIIDGEIKGVFIKGENPIVSEVDADHVDKALNRAEFVVVQDIFMTETARYADVVLPASSFAEKDGTFTNTDRRVQRVREAVKPIGNSKPDWRILTELLQRFGYEANYSSPKDIFEELSSVIPQYGGISYDRIEEVGVQWPCLSADHPGTPFLYKDGFFRVNENGENRALLVPNDYEPPAEERDKRYPLILTTGRLLYHYHTGTMTRKVDGINDVYGESHVEINPMVAKRYKLKHGDRIKVKSRRGEVITRVMISENIKKGVIFMPFHFAESAANKLTNPVFDETVKMPEFKACACRIEKVE